MGVSTSKKADVACLPLPSEARPIIHANVRPSTSDFNAGSASQMPPHSFRSGPRNS